VSGEPWWSSDGADHLDRDQDPLAAHLSARRGEPTRPDGVAEDGADDPDESAPGTAGDRARPDDDHDDPPGEHDPAICGVCPICRGWATLEGRHPDVATNLALAGRHLALALRGLADVVEQAADAAPAPAAGDPDDRGSQATPGSGDDTRFRPIILDDSRLDDNTGEPA